MPLSQDIYKFAFKENPLPAAVTDGDGMILDVSDALLAELDMSREGLIGTAIFPLIGNKDLKPGATRAVSLKKKKYHVTSKNYEIDGIIFRVFVFQEIIEIKHASPKTELIETLLRNSYRIENFPRFLSKNIRIISEKTQAEGALFLTKDMETGVFKPVSYYGLGEKIPKKLTVEFKDEDQFTSGTLYLSLIHI